MMRLLGGAAFAAAALLSAALPAAAQVPVYDWSGPYVGANVGGDFGNADSKTSTVFNAKGYFANTSVPAIAAIGHQSVGTSGFNGGGQAGYNWQQGYFVFGGEVGFGAMDANGSATGTGVYPCCAPTTFTVRQSVSTSWLFTARPRIGFAFDNFLITGSAGLALTDVSYNSVFTDTFATAHASGGTSQVKLGWTAGAGVQYGLTPNWSLRLEYLYTDFGKVATSSTNLTAFTPPTAFTANKYSFSSDLTNNIVRIGVDYRF